MTNTKFIQNLVYFAECILSMAEINVMRRRHESHDIPRSSCIYCEIQAEAARKQYQAENSPYPTQFIPVNVPTIKVSYVDGKERKGWN